MAPNRLATETSPYLLQHQDNPVDWWPWGPEAFAEARRSDRPILLSIGYAACHWCHVMAHESFEDPALALVINTLFVPVKVDREERPDIDALYQGALALTGESGGWPLTLFLTPDGAPFVGGTYFPKTARHGRPAFVSVLKQVSDIHRTRPAEVAASAASLTRGLRRLHATPTSDHTGVPNTPPDAAASLPEPEVLDRLARALLPQMDPRHGGLHGAPKFPMPAVFAFLWRIGLSQGDADVIAAVRQMLEGVCQGGIYDHLGGGFARYATDAAWLVPHFEKMLSDNGQLVALMTQVWRATRDPLLARRIRDTIDWMDREMTAAHDTFAASLDADSDGREGAAYVWTAAQIDALLPPDRAARIKAAYGVTEAGTWEGVSILHRPMRRPLPPPNPAPGRPGPAIDGDPDPDHDTDPDAALAADRLRLLRHRADRIQPRRDDKILADWNGLAIAGLARAGLALAEPAWIDRAARAFAGVRALLDQPDNRLGHCWCRGKTQAMGLLEDYAAMAGAALALLEATGDPAYQDAATAWADRVAQDFTDASGGLFQTPASATDLPVRPRSQTDGAQPAGAGVMAEVWARLFLLTGEERHRSRAEAVLASLGHDLVARFPLTATALGAVDLLARGLTVTLEADPTGELAAILAAAPRAPDAILRPRSPAGGRAGREGAGRGDPTAVSPRAHVCLGSVCGPPLSTGPALARALAGAEDRGQKTEDR